MCHDCCNIHRTLGRHVSDISSLQHSQWAPSRIEMLQQLIQNGANKIWEHELHSSNPSKNWPNKPLPGDKLRPNKSEFIVAKYKDLKFCQAIDNVNIDPLNKQLMMSVTQNSLETTLRLLVMGAEPNCTNEELMTPLHAAAASNQLLQYELLSVYGANPNAVNQSNLTPHDIASKCQHFKMANRVLALQYELTDRLTYYLADKKPDHDNGQHLIMPETDRSNVATEAKNKLKMLNNQSFEELAADIYDEVDRRETETIWRALKGVNNVEVPFLPTNPSFSSTRNQGRSKLGRLTARDFAVLISHVLEDGQRREVRPVTTSSYDDDEEHSYCDVPCEYSDNEPNYDEVHNSFSNSSQLNDEGHSSPVYDQVPEQDDYDDRDRILVQKLSQYERSMKLLREQNSQLMGRVNTLEMQNGKLERDNRDLRSRLEALSTTQDDYDLPHTGRNEYMNVKKSSGEGHKKVRRQARHHSLPSMDTITEKTQYITQAVSLLRDAIRDGKYQLLPDIYQRIAIAAQGVSSVFPENPTWQTVRASLELLHTSVQNLKKLNPQHLAGDQKQQCIEQHIIHAKDIARATKALMAYVENSFKK